MTHLVFRTTAAICAIDILCQLLLLAADVLWDGNAATAGLTDGAGTWNAANQWWNVAGNTNQTWSAGDNAHIGAFGTGGAINTGGDITVGSMVFGSFSSGYTITHTASAVLTITNGLAVRNNYFGGPVTIGSANLAVRVGADQTWQNNEDGGGDALTIGGDLTGNATSGNRTLTVRGQSLYYFTNQKNGGATMTGIVGDGSGGGKLALVKSDAGSLVLSGNNTFTGGLTVNDGVVYIGHAAGFGTGKLTLAGGDLRATGAGRTAANAVDVTGNVIFGVNDYPGGASAQTLTLSGAMDLKGTSRTFNVLNTANTTFSGVISNGGLTKDGTGNLILGNANSYTGATTNKLGTLTLDFSNASAPASDIINSGSALTLYGGTVQVTGKSGANNTQTFNGLSVTGAGAISTTQNGATSLNVALGAISRNAPGTVRFTKPTTGNITTTTGNTTGILGAWAFFGDNDYAKNDGANNIAALGAAVNNTETTWDTTGTANLNINAGNTLTASRSVHTLRWTTGTAALSLGNAGAFDFTTDGILEAGGGGTFTISRGGTSTGRLVIGGTGELVIGGPSAQNVTISVPIAGVGNLVKTGANTVTINTSAATFSGTTYVTQGTLSLGIAGALGSSNPTVLSGGTLSAAIANALNGQTVTVNDGGIVGSTVADGLTNATINVNSGGTVSPTAGANTLRGAAINLQGGTVVLSWPGSSGTVVWGGAVNVLADSTIKTRGNNNAVGQINSLAMNNGARLVVDIADNTLGVANALTMTGNGTIEARSTGSSAAMVFNSLNGSGTLTKTGNQTLRLAGVASGFTGGVVVDRGTLDLNGPNVLAGATVVTVNNGGMVQVSAANVLAGIDGAANITVNAGGVLLVSTYGTTGALAGTGAANPVRLNGGTLVFNQPNVTGTTVAQGYVRVDDDSSIAFGSGNNHRTSVDTVEFTNGKRLSVYTLGAGNRYLALRNVILPAGGTATVQNLLTGSTYPVQLGCAENVGSGSITFTGNTQLSLTGSAATQTFLRGTLNGAGNTLTLTGTGQGPWEIPPTS